MDPTPSPLARVGQVFWAALNYVTAAVQRYLTPELANTGNDDTSTGQEATISVATETQEWTDDGKHERENNERAEKKMREDGESVADACDSGCGHAKTWEQCMVSIATETDRKTDQYVVKDIKVRVTEKVIEREDVGKEPTTQIENEAKSPHFNDEERDIKRHGSILKSGGEQKTKRVEEKTKDKESGKLFCDGDGGKQNETKDRDREREGEHEDLTKTDEVRTIRGAEEENEVLRELIEEAVVMLVEDDEMDIETKGLRNKEGTEEKIQPEGNAGHTEKAELKGEEEEMKETDRNSEVVKITEIHWEKFDAKEKDEKTATRLDNKENEETEEIKETIDKGVELHGPLDFTAQKCRIALKNPHSRPPRNPRTLLHTPSLLPTPSKSPQSGQLNIVSMAVKQGGPRITGFRLPGMDGGFPALKRTHRGAREREEGVTAENSKAPDATETLNSEREELVGDNVVGPGVIGLKLPSFHVEFPGLRKTERGVNMTEQTPEKDTTPHNNSTERSDRTETDSIKGITVQAVKLTTGFGSGFPVLRKTDRGVRIREDDTQNSDVEVKTTVVDHQESLPKSKSKWTPPGKPGIGIGNPSMMSELKNKLRKTE
ncbi:hypothetical protein SKAU_G00131740 [Synaphobranchus kaupii]|uniref:Uncharacterized protein n=1 Tax=Synaphobranchus kaupii TaxID=118154 RepID=A0A9Q1FRK6_SYNKA|nr:hypothetical protein SKAU_G00131740 [Synaphobranchus kaupii]